MKVNNILQNAVTDMMHTVQAAVRETRKQSEVSKVAKKTDTSQAGLRKSGLKAAQNIKRSDVPEPLVNLSANEQAFFEDLYPKARKEIRAYIAQQKNVSHLKGQLFDARG